MEMVSLQAKAIMGWIGYDEWFLLLYIIYYYCWYKIQPDYDASGQATLIIWTNNFL